MREVVFAAVVSMTPAVVSLVNTVAWQLVAQADVIDPAMRGRGDSWWSEAAKQAPALALFVVMGYFSLRYIQKRDDAFADREEKRDSVMAQRDAALMAYISTRDEQINAYMRGRDERMKDVGVQFASVQERSFLLIQQNIELNAKVAVLLEQSMQLNAKLEEFIERQG